MSFFAYVRTMNSSVDNQRVTGEECCTMARRKQCKAGVLDGHDGVFMTRNQLVAKYEWCCTYRHAQAQVENCAVIETKVYKRFGKPLECSVGSLEGCHYKDGACSLEDGSILIWDKNQNNSCKYLPWVTLQGKYAGGFFVNNDQDLALTFTTGKTVVTCGGELANVSYQGIIARFLTPIVNLTLANHVKNEYGVQGDESQLGPSLNIVNSMLQASSHQLMQLVKESFWQSYLYGCKALSEYMELLKGLIISHPTITIKQIMRKSDLYVKVSLGALEVYSCYQLKPEQCEVLPINGTCSELLPIKFEYVNMTYHAYVNLLDNVVHPFSIDTSCETDRDRPVYIDRKTRLYNIESGKLELLETIEVIDLSSVSLNTSGLQVSEAIYRAATMLHWEDMANPHSLNDIFTVITRQKRVIDAMGFKWKGDPGAAAGENIERIFEKGYFSFLLGGHWGSTFEIWTFVVCMVVTMVTAIKCFRLGLRAKHHGREYFRVLWERMIPVNSIQDDEEIMLLGHTSTDGGLTGKVKQCEEAALSQGGLYPDLKRLMIQDGAKRINSAGGIVKVPVKLHGIRFSALWDSSSSISLISESVARALKLELIKTRIRATAVTGSSYN